MRRRLGALSTVVVIGALFTSACGGEPTATQPTAVTGSATTEATTQLGGLTSQPTAAVIETATAEPSPTAAPEVTYTVQRGTIEHTLNLNGQVAPLQYDLTFTQDGILKTIHVQPGQEVEEGQLVAELELGDLPDQLRQAQMTNKQDRIALNKTAQEGQQQIRRAQIDLEAAKTDLESLRSPSAQQISAAQVAVSQAQANLSLAKNNSSQEKNLAKQELDDATRGLQEVQNRYAQAKFKYEQAQGTDQADSARVSFEAIETELRRAEDRVSRAVITYDTARNNEIAAIQKAEADLALAQDQLARLHKGPDKYELAKKQQAVQLAQLALEQAKQRAEPDPGLVKVVESGELEIQRIERQIKERQLYAPISGEVASINLTARAPVQIGTSAITLVNRSQLEIVAGNETELSQDLVANAPISVGQPVTVTLSRYTGETFTGTVVRTPLLSSANPADTMYHISFDKQEKDISVGDPADITVSLGRKYDVLWLPPEAVRSNRDRTFVLLRDGDDNRRVDVQLGIVSADKIEILGGLKEGDVVIGE